MSEKSDFFKEIMSRGPLEWEHLSVEDRTKLIGRVPCCIDDTGGSHYHCARCGKTSSMQGHYSRIHGTEFHFCCPGDCELEEMETQVALENLEEVQEW